MVDGLGTVDQRSQARDVHDLAGDRPRPEGRYLAGRNGRSGESGHFVPVLDEVTEERRTDDTRATRDGDSHLCTSVGSVRIVCQKAVM